MTTTDLPQTLIDEVTKRQGQTDVDFTEYHVRLTETLYCGLSRQDLERLVDQSPAPSLPVLTRGAEVLASLRQIRFDPSLSEQMVDMGLKQGFFTSEQRNFSRVIATAKEKGLPDGQIATAALAVISVRGTVSELASQLGITDQDLGRQGPQVGVGRSGSSSKGKDGVGSPGSGRAGSSVGGLGAGSGAGRGEGAGHGGGAGGGGGSVAEVVLAALAVVPAVAVRRREVALAVAVAMVAAVVPVAGGGGDGGGSGGAGGGRWLWRWWLRLVAVVPAVGWWRRWFRWRRRWWGSGGR